MHQKIVEEAFSKIREEAQTKEGVKLSKTQASEYLSNLLNDEYKVQFGDRRLRDVLNNVTEIKQSDVLKALCNFLGHEDYQSYLKDKFPEKTKEQKDITTTEIKNRNLNDFIERNKIVIIVVILILLLSFTYVFSVQKQRWMVWKEDHYEEVSFDPKKYGIGQLKLYKEERIENFKKIKGECDYTFFNNGEIKVWYGKNNKGELELFTSIGLHPETGKTLKPITKYMIRKYICPDFDK
ncbi:hypothetical protein [Tenacibaculum sp. IB213877]|uniref:hypothetical protein n=1 Tax=Tenacibaculum sp. IB213877 TaxID=3097351 RepID=UPI002A5AD16C|nr:hypothetical protein [Tenacibaculum sp. IB213877]MDY0780961.1 hypothetical protein [Tenacibaculum sp. IB213877]